MKKKNYLYYIFQTITVLITIILICFVCYGIYLGIFSDKEFLVEYINKLGNFASIFFLCLQALQVVFPVIPGGASCLAGVLAFGPLQGFIYNYLGLTIGSVIAFFLSRKYGVKIIYNLFKKEQIEKYIKYVNTSTFQTIFFLIILLPGLPDDLLCYIAGLSKMKFRVFLAIILIGKPLTLIFYSLFLEYFL